jgi:dGTPase
LAAIIKHDFKPEKLAGPGSENEKIAVLRALAIGKLVDECASVFLDNEEQILNATFDRALTDHCVSKKALEDISTMSMTKIYRSRAVVEIEASGHEVLPGLLHDFIRAAEYQFESKATQAYIPRKFQNMGLLLPSETQHAIVNANSIYEVLRSVLDFVSGLTDKHALSLFRKIKGTSV